MGFGSWAHGEHPLSLTEGSGTPAVQEHKENAFPGRASPEKASGFLVRQPLCQRWAMGYVQAPPTSPIPC